MARQNFKNKIRIAEGFQYSVNVGYDLGNDYKIKSFIPTTASLDIIEDFMLSTADSSTDRARILIGAYGKGKSHMVLVLLSLLTRKDPGLFDELIDKIKVYNKDLSQFIVDYLCSDKKLFPIIIQGSNASLTQSFLGALQRALDAEGFEDFMPETHFKAAIDRIIDWEMNYHDTYKMFAKRLNQPVEDFKLRLSEYDEDAYDQFVELYPSLTSGSAFNPFLGFDVIDLYTSVIEKLRSRGFCGVFVVYDEFSKFLEAGITKVSSGDIKLLQDFAEKCNRSRNEQMHLLLISHKDISNYIDKLPKQKVDGWKGVSERFKHIEIRNYFSQVYEIIATVIKHNEEFFTDFFNRYSNRFIDIANSLTQTNLFSELTDEELRTVIYGCYPLHPVSTFILPRVSEKVAQNERTLFTFLSSQNKKTLSAFLENVKGEFPMVTPDYIYDYFEPLFKRDVYTSEAHQMYLLTTNILGKLEPESLGSKIIKTLALIYITGQFEKLPPIPDIIIDTFRESVDDVSEIIATLRDLQDKQYVIYMKKSNNFLRLKNSIGIDIGSKIADTIEKIKTQQRAKDIINSMSFDSYLYPTSYNDDNEITRYFDFCFIDGSEFLAVENWDKKVSIASGDGLVFGIIPKDVEEIKKIRDILMAKKVAHEHTVFILPISQFDIEKIAFEYQAIKFLKAQSTDDETLVEEFNIYIEDLEEVIDQFISKYTKPEMRQCEYFYMGEQQQILRKAQISQLLSKICSDVFTDTPIINNEAINKDFLPTVAINSRGKVIAGLLSNKLRPNLGLVGTGQDTSIMRSTLVMTGILTDLETQPRLIVSGNPDSKMQKVIDEIFLFFKSTSDSHAASFQILYDRLTKPEHHIGLKKGVIPIYIAAVLHFYKQYAVIMRGNRELEINAELLNSINENPDEYRIYLEDWNAAKDDYISALEGIFSDDILQIEKEYNTFAYIVRAMQRWFMKLPSFTKEMKQHYIGNGQFKKIEVEKLSFVRSLKDPEINAREYLFVKVVSIFNRNTVTPIVIDSIREVKALLDKAKDNLVKTLISDVRNIFQTKQMDKASLSSVIKDWYEGLQDTTTCHLFSSGEDRVLELMRTINSDERIFTERLAKALTGLRIDDWDDKTIGYFLDELKKFKETVETQDKHFTSSNVSQSNNVYKLTYIDEDGNERIKTFNKIEYSNMARLLINEINSALDEYGQALSDGEKRQVLMEIIEKLC